MECVVACYPDSTAAALVRFAEGEQITGIAEYVEAEAGQGADALHRRDNLQRVNIGLTRDPVVADRLVAGIR